MCLRQAVRLAIHRTPRRPQPRPCTPVAVSFLGAARPSQVLASLSPAPCVQRPSLVAHRAGQSPGLPGQRRGSRAARGRCFRRAALPLAQRRV